MLLGALLDAGASLAVVQSAVDAVSGGAVRVSTREVRRGGLRALKAEVEALTDDPPHRTWRDVREMLGRAGDAGATATGVFRRLAEAEGRVHGIAADDVHFHEVGALDAIADVVGCCAALADLSVSGVSAGPVALGSGSVRARHGRLPVPAPAVAELAKGWRVSGGGDGELATPTGLALLRTFAHACEALPPMLLDTVGIGAGTRNPAGHANVVRVLIGTAEGGGGSPSVGGSGSPAEGGSGSPAEGGSGSPAEGGSGSPAEGGSSPAEGGSSPAEGGSSPAEGGSSPAEGGSSPAEGGSSPAEGGSSPAEGGSSPAEGGSSPAEGGGSPAAGGNGSPAEGGSSRAEGGGFPAVPRKRSESAVLLEANVDDLDPRLWPGILAGLLRRGASDAWLVPIMMKKGRPAHTLSVLCPPTLAAALRDQVFRDTSTLGVRHTELGKVALERAFADITVGDTRIAVKVGHRDGVVVQVMPEFEDVAALARRQDRPERLVLQDALTAATGAGLIVGAALPADLRPA